MGKGGGQSATQTQIQDVPDWAKPYYEDILARTKALSEQPYVPYGQQRLATPTQDVTTSQGMVRGIAGQPIAEFGRAADITRGLGGRAAMLGMQQAPDFAQAVYSPFGEVFQPYQYREPTQFSQYEFQPEFQFQQAQFTQPERFTAETAQEYMSPYMRSVVEQQKSQAQLEFDRQRAARSAQAVQAGAFGGSRQGVQEALAEEALARQIGGIEATGLQSAYEQGLSQFGADRTARMETERLRAAEAARVQGSQAAELARVDQARYAELANREQAQAAEFARAGDQAAADAARVQAARYADLARMQEGVASETARVQAARAQEAMAQRQFELNTLAFRADMARQLSDLGERARAGDIQAAQLLEAQGLGEMGRTQAGLDMAYQDFLRQQQYPAQQLGLYSQFLRGLPVGEAGTSTTYMPTPSAAQQAMGLGISMAGLYGALK